MKVFNLALLLGLLTLKYGWPYAYEELCNLIPKVELHAHLHGSIRQSTLEEFSLNRDYVGNLKSLLEGERDLGKCFGIFHEIHKLIRTSDNLRRVVMEVLEDFMADNVIYLELRSTPRTLEDGTTQLEYTEMLTSVIEAHNLRHGDTMTVRLLLSIDRSKSINENTKVLDIAFRLSSRSNVIVGIDFSGNPHNGRFVDFVSLLYTCRDIGLFITVHAAEILDSRCTETLESCKNEIFSSTCSKVVQEVGVCTDVLTLFEPTSETSEMDDIIAFRPHRLGHALHLKAYQINSVWYGMAWYELILYLQIFYPEALVVNWSLLAAYNSTAAPIGTEGALAHGTFPSAEAPPKGPPLIEICPTSNSFTLNLTDLNDHPTLGTWIHTGYPISISTDDSGVFATSLSKEFYLVQSAFNLSTTEVIRLAGSPIDYIFSPELIPHVRAIFNTRLDALGLPLYFTWSVKEYVKK